MPSVTLLAPSLTSTLLKWLFPRDQWCIAKNGGGGYTQMAVENGLKVLSRPARHNRVIIVRTSELFNLNCVGL